MTRSRSAGLGWVVALVSLAAAACAPAVPELAQLPGDAAAVVSTTSPFRVSTTAAPPRTTAGSSTAAPSSTPAPATTTAPTTTSLADSPSELTFGRWTLTAETRDEGGTDFTATLTVPTLRADVDAALLGRIATNIEGQVESQVGSTLALWRSIEAEGSRDISDSTLRLEFDVAGFEEDFISMRFFSDERVAASGGAKRQATTLMMDLTSGTAIGLDEIVVGAERREALLALVGAGLLDGYFDGDTEAFSLWAGDLEIGDLDQVALTPEGLEVWFDELEVGPPDIGMPMVAIPYDDLTGILEAAGPATVFRG